MRLEKIYQSRLVVEVASIVFAVLFALWVNEWRSNIRLKTLVQEQKMRVINEMHANKAELEKVLADNQVKLDSLISFQKQKSWWKTKDIDGIEIGWGYNFADLKSAAWETTLLLNIAPALKAEFLSNLSEVQSLQEKYDEFSTELLREFGAETALLDNDRRLALNKHKFNLLVSQELGGHLLKAYNQFLEKYNRDRN